MKLWNSKRRMSSTWGKQRQKEEKLS